MKRGLKAAAWLILMGMIAIGPFLAALLPVSSGELVRERYASWCGVLRIWKCEGWQCGSGSMNGWLNGCIAKFEKSHPGVYVQVTETSQEAIRGFREGKVNPPDAILYAPGMLETPSGLKELPESSGVRKSLQKVGWYGGIRYAVPVAMGGYALAINNVLLPETPPDWSGIPADEYPALTVQRDGDYLSWSAAVIAMFSGSSQMEGKEEVLIGEGINLGLPETGAEETRQPTEYADNALPMELERSDAAYKEFIAGNAAAIPVTQREIIRLRQLSENGKGPDWRIEAIGGAFSDQLMLFSIVEWPREDAEQRYRLCAEFMNLMLSEQRQSELERACAFPVLEGIKLYSGSDMGAIERAVGEETLITPPVFSDDWRRRAGEMMDAIAPGGTTKEAWKRLKECMETEESMTKPF